MEDIYWKILMALDEQMMFALQIETDKKILANIYKNYVNVRKIIDEIFYNEIISEDDSDWIAPC
jgi:hypothetical protein